MTGVTPTGAHRMTPTSRPMSFLSRLLSPDHARWDGVRPIQIYLLRTFYFLVAAFVGTDAWTTVLTHQGPWDHVRAVAWCMWVAYATMSVLGLIHPLRMLPLMIFVIFYKTLWLAVVAYPLWRAGTLTGATEEMAKVFMWMWILALAVPWGYAWRTYVRRERTGRHAPSHSASHA
jgi:hypothetical protein